MKEKMAGNAIEIPVGTEKTFNKVYETIVGYLPEKRAGFYHGKDENDYVGVNINSVELARKIVEALNEV